MAVPTMGFMGIMLWANNILRFRDKLQVDWITAKRIAALMVNFFGWRVFTPLTRNWPYSPSVHQSVRFLHCSVPSYLSIGMNGMGSMPKPTRSTVPFQFRANCDVFENPNDFFKWNVIYGKIFLSHCETNLSFLVEPSRSCLAVWRLALL